MTALDLFAALLFSFGTVAYATVFFDYLRELRGRRIRVAEIVDGAITLACAGWFLVNTLIALSPLRPDLETWPLWTVFLFLCFLFPALIMNVTYTGVEPCRPGKRHAGWRVWIVAAYVVGLGLFGLQVWLAFGRAPLPRRLIQPLLGSSIPILYILAAAFSMIFVARTRKTEESPKRRQERRWHLVVLAVMIFLFLPLLLSAWKQIPLAELMTVLARALPLAFLFVFTYHESRYQFFDVLIKRGAVTLLMLAVLAGGFALALPWLGRLDAGWAEPWIFAIFMLPLALTLPWLSRRMGEWVDYVWLGRRFTPEEAVRHFLGGLRGALSEDELIELAELRLSTIFRAPTRIDLMLRAAPTEFATTVEVPVRVGQSNAGVIRLGARESDMPYFSQDVELLRSLADVFSSLLQNARLQRKKLEQDQLAQELSLQASRSELKALRAQINPHFLFNALNAIAGLIHEDPLRADRAVEHLAEVFRYTLRGSEKEWTPLEEEIEFVRAYLAVESARFGPRLEIRIDVEPATRPLVVPTMLLQTLVENAVKHGVASVRGQGRIEITARRDADFLFVEVADNGSGFVEGAEVAAAGESNRGYGLANVRQRLAGHFGDEARLRICRDDSHGLTRVVIELPLARLEGAARDDGPANAVSS